jgi:enamine deaminase RidA (YjgF/YER057c/UK114 family)
MSQAILQPPGWPRPKGYSNGIVARGRQVYIAGQIGWDVEGRFHATLAAQVRQALENVIAVLAEAGGRPEHLVRLTWYVTSRDDYYAELPGDWRCLPRGDRPTLSRDVCGAGRRTDGSRREGRDRGHGGHPGPGLRPRPIDRQSPPVSSATPHRT